MKYKPQSHGKKMMINWTAIWKTLFAAILWSMVCGLMWWAIFKMLIDYTE